MVEGLAVVVRTPLREAVELEVFRPELLHEMAHVPAHVLLGVRLRRIEDVVAAPVRQRLAVRIVKEDLRAHGVVRLVPRPEGHGPQARPEAPPADLVHQPAHPVRELTLVHAPVVGAHLHLQVVRLPHLYGEVLHPERDKMLSGEVGDAQHLLLVRVLKEAVVAEPAVGRPREARLVEGLVVGADAAEEALLKRQRRHGRAGVISGRSRV